MHWPLGRVALDGYISNTALKYSCLGRFPDKKKRPFPGSPMQLPHDRVPSLTCVSLTYFTLVNCSKALPLNAALPPWSKDTMIRLSLFVLLKKNTVQMAD